MERGYVKLYRSIDQNELLENDNTAFVVFMKLLTRVDRRTGTYTTGRKKLAAMCNLNPNTLYSALKRLEASTIIQQQSNKTSTTIYICNWWKYQQDDNTASNDRQLTVNTKQEKKEKKNINTGGREAKVLDLCNSILGRDFRMLPTGAKTTLDKFTDEEIERAFRNMLKDVWHKPRVKELKSPYLFRASTIDSLKDYKSAVERSTEVKQVNVTNSPVMPQLSRSEMIRREYERN